LGAAQHVVPRSKWSLVITRTSVTAVKQVGEHHNLCLYYRLEFHD